MSTTLINRGLSLVTQEVNQILSTYPYYPHQQLFANPELKQKLIVNILNQIPGNYQLISEAIEAWDCSEVISMDTPERRIHIQTLIHRGIADLLQENTSWIGLQAPNYGLNSPSNWFG